MALHGAAKYTFMRYYELYEDIKVQRGLETLADAIILWWSQKIPQAVRGYQGYHGNIDNFGRSDVPSFGSTDVDPKSIPMPVRRLLRKTLDIKLRYQDSYENRGHGVYQIEIEAPKGILDPTTLYDSDRLRQLLSQVRPSLVHELTHAWNDLQSKGKFVRNRRSAATRSTWDAYQADPSSENQLAWSKAYVRDPTEINAAFQAAVAATPMYGSFDAYVSEFYEHLPQFEFWPPTVQQRLRTRLYKHWSEASHRADGRG